MTTILFAGGLTVLWVLAWGEASVANVVSGLAVAIGLLVLTPDSWGWRSRPPIRPVAIARFLLQVSVTIVRSNLMLTRQVLSIHPKLHTGVVAVPLPRCSDGLLTLVTNVLALAPGTMAVDTDREPDTIVYVHLLDSRHPDVARHDVRHLAELAYRAFGSDRAISEFSDDPATPATEEPA